MHYKSANYFKQENAVSNQDGIIKNIVIVTEGVDKDLGYFTPEFLDALIAQANSQPKGVKCRFGHPNMCKTTLGSYIGRYKNFRKEENKVLADLHLAEIAKQTQVEGRGISMWDYVLGMSEQDDEAFGNSIHFIADTTYEEKEINGEMREVEVYGFESLIASDLVDTPAATESLFKNSDDLGLMVTNFLDENPTIFKAIEDNPSIIDEFFNKYKFYQKKKKMGIIKKIQEKLKVQKDIDLTLASGDIITVVTDNENPQVGDTVVDADGTPLADGEHLLPDGGKLVVESGKITEILEAEEEQEEEEKSEAVQELKEAKTAIAKQARKIKDLEEAVGILADDLVILRKSVKSSFKVDKEQGGQSPYNGKVADDVYSKYTKKKEE